MRWDRNHWSYSNLLLLRETGYWGGVETIGAAVTYCYYRRLDTVVGGCAQECTMSAEPAHAHQHGPGAHALIFFFIFFFKKKKGSRR